MMIGEEETIEKGTASYENKDGSPFFDAKRGHEMADCKSEVRILGF